MSAPIYYKQSMGPANDSTWLAALSEVISNILTGVTPAGGAGELIEFSVGVVASAGTQVVVDNVSLFVGYNDTNTIQIGDKLYPIVDGKVVDNGIEYPLNVAVGSIFTGAATTFILFVAGANPLSVVGITTAATVGVVYSAFVSTPVSQALDELSGTVDVNLRLRDTNGNFVYGALYKDGYSVGQDDLGASADLLDSAESHGAVSSLQAGMSVEVITGTNSSGAIYTLYNDNILLGIAEITGVTTQFYEHLIMRDHASEVLHFGDENLLLASPEGGFNGNSGQNAIFG